MNDIEPNEYSEEQKIEIAVQAAAVEYARTVARSVDDLPILARLEFAKNLVFDNGGHPDKDPLNAGLMTAVDVLNGVIDVVKRRPEIAKIRSADPEP